MVGQIPFTASVRVNRGSGKVSAVSRITIWAGDKPVGQANLGGAYDEKSALREFRRFPGKFLLTKRKS